MDYFEKSFLDIYTHKLGTIKSSDAPVTAERFRRDITEALEPLAIEMGADAADIGMTVHPHPTLSETLGFSAEMIEGTITDLLVKKR